jgi:hypothetical protein
MTISKDVRLAHDPINNLSEILWKSLKNLRFRNGRLLLATDHALENGYQIIFVVGYPDTTEQEASFGLLTSSLASALRVPRGRP